MAKHHVCDNPVCEVEFHVEEDPIYCPQCIPLLHKWKTEEKDKMAHNASDFAQKMIVARNEFFKKNTPVTRAPQKVTKVAHKQKRG